MTLCVNHFYIVENVTVTARYIVNVCVRVREREIIKYKLSVNQFELN